MATKEEKKQKKLEAIQDKVLTTTNTPYEVEALKYLIRAFKKLDNKHVLDTKSELYLRSKDQKINIKNSSLISKTEIKIGREKLGSTTYHLGIEYNKTGIINSYIAPINYNSRQYMLKTLIPDYLSVGGCKNEQDIKTFLDLINPHYISEKEKNYLLKEYKEGYKKARAIAELKDTNHTLKQLFEEKAKLGVEEEGSKTEIKILEQKLKDATNHLSEIKKHQENVEAKIDNFASMQIGTK